MDERPRCRTLKTLKKKTYEDHFMTLDVAMILTMTLKAQASKTKIKIKGFRSSKDTINRMKRQPMEWERVFVNHVFYRD